MKYLVIIESSVGIGNATIFDTLEAAKNHLKKIASSLKYPLHTEWENDEYLIIKAAHNNWTKAYIVKTDRAEYRLVRHVRGKKDEERETQEQIAQRLRERKSQIEDLRSIANSSPF